MNMCLLACLFLFHKDMGLGKYFTLDYESFYLLFSAASMTH